MFNVPYDRPIAFTVTRLANDTAECNSVLALDDSCLSIDDFECVFQVGGPAGRYHETVYFLPLALNHLRNDAISSLKLGPAVTWFFANFAERLLEDNLFQFTSAAFVEVIATWTQEFRVVHFAESEMLAKGSSRKHADIASHSQEVGVLLESVCTYPSLRQLAHILTARIALYTGEVANSGWYLELLRQHCSGERDFSSVIDVFKAAMNTSHLQCILGSGTTLPDTYVNEIRGVVNWFAEMRD